MGVGTGLALAIIEVYWLLLNQLLVVLVDVGELVIRGLVLVLERGLLVGFAVDFLVAL